MLDVGLMRAEWVATGCFLSKPGCGTPDQMSATPGLAVRVGCQLAQLGKGGGGLAFYTNQAWLSPHPRGSVLSFPRQWGHLVAGSVTDCTRLGWGKLFLVKAGASFLSGAAQPMVATEEEQP